MARWLTTNEQSTWRAWLSAHRLLDAALEAQMQNESSMPLTHYVVLAMLSEAQDGQLRMSELAAQTQSSRSRISHAIARLSERGWVERLPDETDRRGQIARLTDEGRDVVISAAPAHVNRVRTAMFDVLSQDEVAVLGDICHRIASRLEDELISDGGVRVRPVAR